MITMKSVPGTMRVLVKIAAIASVSLAAQLSHALEITEIEPNDRTDIAQNIDPFFSTGFVLNIESGPTSNDSATVPHVTINSLPGDDTFDIFSFTVDMAGSMGIFDTDNAEISGMDSYLRLFDVDGSTVLAENDDSFFDGPGDQIANTFNSFLTYDFTNPGVYFIEVGETPLTPNGPPTEVLPGSEYQLHVSLAAPAQVPEPGTLALFGLGIIGVGLSRRRRA